MTPCVLLAPWSSARSISSAIERLQTSYPRGRYFLDIDRDYTYSNPEALAQMELMRLSNPTNAFASWCDFINKHERVMPCLQLRNQTVDDIRRQMDKYRE